MLITEWFNFQYWGSDENGGYKNREERYESNSKYEFL